MVSILGELRRGHNGPAFLPPQAASEWDRFLPGGREPRRPGRGREKLKVRWWVGVGEGEEAHPSRLMLWARRRHSTDRRSLHCLWQFTPQAGEADGEPGGATGQHTLPPVLQASTSPRVPSLLSSCPTETKASFQRALLILFAILCPLQKPFTYNHHLPGSKGFTPLQLPHQNKSPHPESNSSPKNQPSSCAISPRHLRPCL